MFEPRHVLGLPSLLAVSMVLGSTPRGGEAKAESLVSAITSLPSQNLQQAQSAPPSESGQAASNGLVEGDVPFSELNEALAAARARLAELTKAAEIAKVASELRESLEATKAENLQLKAVMNRLEAENSALQAEKHAAIEQAVETERASTEATAEARRLDEELVAMRWQNSQLSTSLARAEALGVDSSEELETTKAQSASQIEALSVAAEESAAEIARLRIELDATRESALIAEQRGAELEAQLAQRSIEAGEAEAEAAKLASDLDVTITELGDARTELATARETLDEVNISLAATGQEAAVLREQFAANREAADKLRQDLEEAENDLQRANTSNDDLRQQVQILRTAAGEATDAARLNLVAVENQINEINAALATVKGDEAVPPSGGPTIPAAIENAANNDSGVNGTAAPAEVAAAADAVWVPKLTPARSAAVKQQQLIVANSPPLAVSSGTKNPPAASSPLANRVIKTSVEADKPADTLSTEFAALVSDLPDDRRQRAETLLADLNVRLGDRGLTMTVPGTILFAVNSEQIEPDAHDTLAKVAEMVDLYSDRNVLVVAHTDAVGDDEYNQVLSERRADLVKSYFVEEFEIANNRLSAEGQGEQRPITSNATAEGRDANRRVEVIVLN